MPRQQKTHAASGRAGGAASNGFPLGASGFGSSSSPISYLAEQPDLSSLSDPNIAVCFKNLSKKDSTTKSRALEELYSYLVRQAEQSLPLEDAFLEAWVRVYPRMAVDLARKVRQTAHSIQGRISVATGKRLARHMPVIVPSWLCGVHDGDKAVMRTASQAMSESFATTEKRSTLKRAFQESIVEYCANAVNNETAMTLSDERNTSKEDADAVYSRVVSSSVTVVADLIASLTEGEIEKKRHVYDEFVGADKTCALVASKDTSVRRAAMRLLQSIIIQVPDIVNGQKHAILKSMLAKQTMRHQTGTAVQFAELLLQFTQRDPKIWQSEAYGTLSPSERLASLVKYGAHSGPAHFWAVVKEIVAIIPEQALPNSVEEGHRLLHALQQGIMGKNELRTNIPIAMECFYQTLDRVMKVLPDTDRLEFAGKYVNPLVDEYLQPRSDNQWSFSAGTAKDVTFKGVAFDFFRAALELDWQNRADIVINGMKASLPEQAKEYSASQAEVEMLSSKFFSLQDKLLGQDIVDSYRRQILATASHITTTAIEQLCARQGKPYGTAACLSEAFTKSTIDIDDSSDSLGAIIDRFITQDLPELITSPSQAHLIAILYRSKNREAFAPAWRLAVNNLIYTAEPEQAARGMQALLTSDDLPRELDIAKKHEDVQAFILKHLTQSLDESEDPVFAKSIMERASILMSAEAIHEAFGLLSQSLLTERLISRTLDILANTARANRRLVQAYVSSSDGPSLLQNLLAVQEMDDELNTSIARKLSSGVLSVQATEAGVPAGAPVQAVLQRGLYEANAESLTIETLINYALDRIEAQPEADLADFLPDTSTWRTSLLESLAVTPSASSAITNELSGLVHTVQGTQSKRPMPEVDREGLSPPIRMAMFSIGIFDKLPPDNNLQANVRSDLFSNLALSTLLANDKLGSENANALWLHQDEQTLSDVSKFVRDARIMLNTISAAELRSYGRESIQDWPASLTKSLWSGIAATDAVSFQFARAFGSTLSNSVEAAGVSKEMQSIAEDQVKSLRRSNQTLELAAFIVAFESVLQGSAALIRVLNESIAELSNISSWSFSTDLLAKLAVLNLIVRAHEDTLDSVAKQRLIFLAKSMNSILESDEANDGMKAEACKLIAAVLPRISDIYGEFWEATVLYLKSFFNQAPRLSRETAGTATVALRHAALKLFGALRALTLQEEANEDLKDTWAALSPDLGQGLLQVLKAGGSVPDESDQALRITNELLARLVAANPPVQNVESEQLFALLAADSHSIQQAAFKILHEQVPRAQEDVSLAAALDKKTARLPDELLSLIITAPDANSVAEASFERNIPAPLLSYLSSWLLVFDHFRNASDRVKSDYAGQLKDGNFVEALLELVFSFLGLSRSRPVDAGKFEPTFYSFDVETDPIKDARWLLIHLYYLCLKRVPSLTKAWLLDKAPRQTRTQAEPWTEKHFSPLIIADALESASKWAAGQSKSSDDALEVKTNERTREVRASREIDEQTLAIAVQLPANFPLGQVTVEPVNRVAVDERRWRSWLMNTAGVIAFSDNSIAEGLMAFARNVSGQIKGQTECAICYSIVGQDRSLPTKKCQTCKNAFHGSCLYRWFRSSNSSSCPLCRTAFNYA